MGAELARSPVAVCAALASAAFLALVPAYAGFRSTSWYPASIFVLGLVVVAALAVPRVRVPLALRIATAALAAYTAWSYLSITWAAQKADAWDGANRTALYALAFSLFATWRIRARPAAYILGALGLGVAAIGLVTLLGAAAADDPSSWFVKGRLADPAGYQNADVALWFTAFWPCAALAARRELAPLARAAVAASAVLLAGLAILGESRGWAIAAPITLVFYLAIVPQKVRAAGTMLVLLGATALCTPALIDVRDAVERGTYGALVADAARALLLAAAAAALVVAVAALVDRRVSVPRAAVRATGAAMLTVAVAAAAIGTGILLAHEGGPSRLASRAWHDFKTRGQPAEHAGPRFTVSLGSSRYDFWRVALDRFADEPLRGLGADNFQQDYLRLRRSDEQPRYPHSVEIRALMQTGVVGATLLAVALAAALFGAIRAVRRRSGIGSAAAAAATTAFAYWFVHGSVDWFWEFAGLGAPAFALLGLAAGLEPRAAMPCRRVPAGMRLRLAWAVTAVVAIALAISLGLPWLSARQESRAVDGWPSDPGAAIARLRNAASLNPLAVRPYLLAASIALRVDQPALARRYFRKALDRDPDAAFPNLELGVLEATAGRRTVGRALVRHARALNPRDGIAARVAQRIEHSKPVNLDAVNAEYERRTRELGR